MNKKEQMFCRAYAALNNLKEAAIHAGYPANEAQRTAETLIAREDIARAVRQFSSHTNDLLCDRAVAGLLRLAFGNADDCVRLAFSDEEPNLSEMNLFNISEILEQLIAKLGIPPFMLGLSWSTTERMSSQQADILTSELEAYRRYLTPVILRIVNIWAGLEGIAADFKVKWHDINLQDEVELARAELLRAQAKNAVKGAEKN